MNAPRQLALALPHAESFAREDFLTGAPNEAALAMIERWPDWPDRALALVGPEGAGKSHLAAIWAEIAGARRVSARALGETNLIGALATGALVIEDAPARLTHVPQKLVLDPDRGWAPVLRDGTCVNESPEPDDEAKRIRSALDERALFHLLNLIREEEAYLLITARAAPARWGAALPDLASRLRALPTVTLSAPDDALLRDVLVKLFADRQLGVDSSLVSYLVTRIERSFAAARAAVETLDREALRMQRPVTRALAAELMRET